MRNALARRLLPSSVMQDEPSMEGHGAPEGAESPPRIELARARVQRAVARLERSERDGLEELEHSLCAYVGALADGGASEELVLTTVRELVAQPTTADGGAALLPAVREALVELSTEWCAAEYARARRVRSQGDAPGAASHDVTDGSSPAVGSASPQPPARTSDLERPA